MPRITVVMSAYHEEEEHIRLAIESILTQSFSDFEFIIILDDPKNEMLNEVISSYARDDLRIKYVVNEENRGLSYCRNAAITMATGQLIALMDADDISATDRLFNEWDYFKTHPSCYAVTSSAIVIDENGSIVRENTYDISDDNVVKALRIKNILMNPTAMIRRETYDIVGPYREIPRAEDYDFWLRCCDSDLTIHFLKEPLLFYRERRDSISHQNAASSWIITDYVKDLHLRRVTGGDDGFSSSDLDSFIRKSKLHDKQEEERFNAYSRKYEKALAQLSSKDYRALFPLLSCFICEPRLVTKFYQSVCIHRLLG